MRKDEYKKTTNAQMLDISIKQTLTRTIYTSLTTVLSVALLAIIGVSSIREFLFPIIIGLVAGTYSSIFIAAQIWGILYKKNIGKDLKKKWYDDEPEEKLIKGVNS